MISIKMHNDCERDLIEHDKRSAGITFLSKYPVKFKHFILLWTKIVVKLIEELFLVATKVYRNYYSDHKIPMHKSDSCRFKAS